MTVLVAEYIDDLSDYAGKLTDLIDRLQSLLEENGDVEIVFDAGANNVLVYLKVPVKDKG